MSKNEYVKEITNIDKLEACEEAIAKHEDLDFPGCTMQVIKSEWILSSSFVLVCMREKKLSFLEKIREALPMCGKW